MNKDLISIIMPAYNSEFNIEDSIKSVINQTYTEWELIIIDDGSEDNTLTIIDHFSNNDSRIKVYVNNINKGVSKTRNKAIDISQGKWLAFIDSDDIWDSKKLEKQLKVIEKYNAKFVFTESIYINEKGELYPGSFNIPRIITYKELRKQNVIATSSVIVSREKIGKLRFENDKIHEDYAMWLNILKNENIIGYGLNEKLLIYRLYRKSKSGNKLKSIYMTYGVFRTLNLNIIQSLYFTLNHLTRSLFKYKNILRG